LANDISTGDYDMPLPRRMLNYMMNMVSTTRVFRLSSVM